MSTPVTSGRRFGLGRKALTPREHCKRCQELVETADQMVLNYILANGRQVEIINRLIKNPDAAQEVVSLGQLLAEKDALITHLYSYVGANLPPGEAQVIQDVIDNYRQEVKDSERHDAGAEGQEASGPAGT